MDTQALRQKIIDLAIRGKLVPQDPNDEPAAALLKRIHTEKLQMVKDGKLKAKDIQGDTVIFNGEDNLHYEKFQDGTVKCIENEIPFEIPDSWAWCRLKVLGQYKKGPFGSNITKSMFVPDGPNTIKVYEQKNAINKDASLGTYFITSEKFQALKSFEVFPNDIIVSCAGTIGETYVLPSDMRPGIINQALMKITLFDINILEFYLIYFDSVLKKSANSQGHGVALKNIPPFDVLKKYLMPLPPLEEQSRIIQQVNFLLNKVNDISLQQSSIRVTVNSIKSKILDLAIRGKLVPQDQNDEPASVLIERIRSEKEKLIKQGKIKRDKNDSVIYKGDDNSYYEKFQDKVICIDDEIPFELPDNWKFIRLKDAWQLLSGRDLSPSKYNSNKDGIPYITGASNFSHGSVSIIRWTQYPQVITKVGDLLITCKGTIGEIAVNDFGDAHIARQIMAIRNTHTLNSGYLRLCIKYYLNLIITSAKGLIPGITREDILDLILPLPPKQYQIRVVRLIKEIDYIALFQANHIK